MNICLVSDLPEYLSLFGFRHHFPVGQARGDASYVGVTMDDGGGGFTERDFTETPDVHPDGRSLVHLTGVSQRLKELARAMHDRGVPVVYSPFPNGTPDRTLFGLLPPLRSDSRRALSAIRETAGIARIVLADDETAAAMLVTHAGIPAGKVKMVPVAPLPVMEPAPPGGPGKANSVIALAGDLSPQWNVLRFIFAMEKLNCHAVIVARTNDSAYSASCLEIAGRNPKVRIIRPDRDAGGGILREFAGAGVVVDPSHEGLGHPLIRAAAGSGGSAVISSRSRLKAGHPDGLFFFDPSSWELLHHAVTSALNRVAEGAAARPAHHATDAASVRSALARVYGEIVGG